MGIRAVFINAEEQREVAAGEKVFADGDTGAEMYGLISGAVEMRSQDARFGPTFALQVMRSMADRIRERDPHS
jgi:CRP-like cAMP-binding protein